MILGFLSAFFILGSQFAFSAATDVAFPQLNFGKAWQTEIVSSPQIAAKFSRTHGYAKIKLVFTKYAVPTLKNSADLIAYLKTQHPEVSKFEILRTKNCGSQWAVCFLVQSFVSRYEKKNYINYLYFISGKKAFLGFTQVNGIADNLIISDILMKELENAVP